ncbi:hypothetical protein ANCCEY_09124 [Ancylostoma ceylanicum]|uniref:RRM domain-containing protein n=1 Tax=Ancylostoma ceylanicum TaxID=53326 RepID=A0A0D6LIH1_9BILA|nr:hypothetical protein ANCCEY_09124 [Ancylostoma ceylanicum]
MHLTGSAQKLRNAEELQPFSLSDESYNQYQNQNKLNESELKLGISGDLGKSWHQKYKDSAWIYIGGLPYDLTEGDIITVFSLGSITHTLLTKSKV